MSEELDLKPCPFCGGKVVLVRGVSQLFKVYCNDCGAVMAFQGCEHPATGRAKTIAAYNRRRERK